MHSQDCSVGEPTEAQIQLGRELAVRFNLDIPTYEFEDRGWLDRFLDVFSYHKDLEEPERSNTGRRLIRVTKSMYRNGAELREIARKFDMKVSDIEFLVDTLKEYGKKSLEIEDVSKDPDNALY